VRRRPGKKRQYLIREPLRRQEAGSGLDAPASIRDTRPRREWIAEAAYYRAEPRGFRGGDPAADWLAAEAEIDALLRQHGHSRAHGGR